MRWRRREAPSSALPLLPVLAAAVVLAALAARFAVAFSQQGMLRIPFGCPFRALTGVPCLSCGATRALAALVEGSLLQAVSFNPLVALTAVAVVSAGFASFVLRAAGVAVPVPQVEPGAQGYLRAGAAGAILANWVYLIVRL